MIFNLRFRSMVRIGYREAGPERSDVPTRLSAMIEQTARGWRHDRVPRSNSHRWFVTPSVLMLARFAQGLWRGGLASFRNRETSVMIESEFLDLSRTGESMIGVSLLISKFARDTGGEAWRTSESGH
jgi:hypothetical protein